MRVYNWGFAGAGNIIHKFVTGLGICDNARKYAIASRNIEKARSYAEEYGIEKAYGSYDELAGDPEVDIVYIGVTNNAHYELIVKFLNAGKHVLCEKPMVLNSSQIIEVAELAKRNGLMLMEALWWRFLPVYETVDTWIAEGKIGELRLVKADFGFESDSLTPGSRLLTPEMGGGALYDVGVYNISFANKYLGEYQNITGFAKMSKSGVDLFSTANIRYKSGAIAQLTSAVNTWTDMDAFIYGSKGSIAVKEYWHAVQAELKVTGEPSVTVSRPFDANGYEYEARHFMDCLDKGKSESDVVSLGSSTATAAVVDELLAIYGYTKS